MLGVRTNRRWGVLFVGVAALLVPFTARAVPVEVRATNVGSISLASLSRLAHEAGELGIKLPPPLTAEGIERQFPFVGAGGFDPDRPVGVFFFAGPGTRFAADAGIAYVLPVKPDVATLKSVLDLGGKPLGNGSGAVEWNGMTFRRTPNNYVIFSRSPDAAIAVREADLLDGYRPPLSPRTGPDVPILRASFDAAACRRADPSRFRMMVDGLTYPAASRSPAAADALRAIAWRITRLDLAMLRSGDELSLKFGIAPIRIPAAGTFTRPGMPEGVVARFDVAAPPMQVMPWLESVFGRFWPGLALSGGRWDDEFRRDAVQILLGGDAVSMGLDPRENVGVFYIVQQHVQADPVARLRQAAERSNLVAAYPVDKTRAAFLEFTQYTTPAGLHVARVKVTEGPACTFCLDLVRRADTVYITGSTDPGQFVESLVGAKQEGHMVGLATGSLNLAAAMAILDDVTGLGGMPPPQRQQLNRILNGRSLTLSATGETDEAVFDAAVPRDLVKDLIAAYSK
ncbi:MAG TPA: hypothetical protein VGI81_11850 [Tepidisphaeraceae bacterium]|jgi:hypothetical protein